MIRLPDLPIHLLKSLFARFSILLVVVALAACSGPSENRVVLHTESGDHTFEVELADTPAQHQRGLMFRQNLADNAGMLFDFHEESLRGFWMQNTYIPLDIIFVDKAGVIKTIHENAVPRDTTQIPSRVPVRFVLEIPGGRASEIGLKEGDRLDHPRVEK